MTHTYNISGMTCTGCVAKVKNELLKLGNIVEADVQLAAPQATITMQQHIHLPDLQQAISKAGNYKITENAPAQNEKESETTLSWFNTYKPVLLLFAYITIVSFIVSYGNGVVNWMLWMQAFMGGFFLSFSFFKMINLKGFAESYAMYDIIAKRWFAWGYIYAFIELLLGLAFISGFNPLVTNSVTFIVMTLSLVGVLQSVIQKRKIQCACLGAVFNLPMSTITIIEDLLMIIMSGLMLAYSL